MKNLIKIISGVLILSFISCSPQIIYLGDTYAPTQNVEIFYDDQDIEKDYKVIGIMKNEAQDLEIDDVESVKKAMIKKAKSVGANAILFVGFHIDRVSQGHGNFDDTKKVYEAKLLKYK